MKLQSLPESAREAVAPHAGAWIETSARSIATGLTSVAPHAGAWIETVGYHVLAAQYIVAPHAGAWIETAGPWPAAAWS